MNTYYINADTGNDTTGDGSSTLPWLTYAKALTASSVDDQIIFQNSSNTFAWANNNNITARILVGESFGNAILDGGNATFGWSMKIGTHTWSNLIFQNAKSQLNNPLFILNNNGTYIFSDTNCVYKNLGVYGNSVADEGLFGNGTDNLGSSVFTHISCLYNNVYMQTSGAAGIFNARSTTSTTHIFTNCTFYFPVTALYTPSGIFLKVDNGYVITMKNTIIANFSGNTLNWFYGSSTGMTQTISNSTLYLVTGAPSGTDILTSDPDFVDADNGEFRLRPPQYDLLGRPIAGTGSPSQGQGILI